MKYRAERVAPEYQESPLDVYGFDYQDTLVVAGNHELVSYTNDLYETVVQVFDEMAYEYQDIVEKVSGRHYRNLTELVNDYFPADEFRHGKAYGTRDIHAVKEALNLFETAYYYDGDYISIMMSAISGHDWRDGQITGCVQRDWQKVIYRADAWNRTKLNCFEQEYFNLVDEYSVEDESGFCLSTYVYDCYGDADDAREYLADELGCAPEDIFMVGVDDEEEDA